MDVTVVKDVVNNTLSFWQVLRKTLGIQRVKIVFIFFSLMTNFVNTCTLKQEHMVKVQYLK